MKRQKLKEELFNGISYNTGDGAAKHVSRDSGLSVAMEDSGDSSGHHGELQQSRNTAAMGEENQSQPWETSAFPKIQEWLECRVDGNPVTNHSHTSPAQRDKSDVTCENEHVAGKHNIGDMDAKTQDKIEVEQEALTEATCTELSAKGDCPTNLQDRNANFNGVDTEEESEEGRNT